MEKLADDNIRKTASKKLHLNQHADEDGRSVNTASVPSGHGNIESFCERGRSPMRLLRYKRGGCQYLPFECNPSTGKESR